MIGREIDMLHAESSNKAFKAVALIAHLTHICSNRFELHFEFFLKWKSIKMWRLQDMWLILANLNKEKIENKELTGIVICSDSITKFLIYNIWILIYIIYKNIRSIHSHCLNILGLLLIIENNDSCTNLLFYTSYLFIYYRIFSITFSITIEFVDVPSSNNYFK